MFNVNLVLFSPLSDPAAKALWESLMNLKHKEALMEIRRHLVEAASREHLPIKMSMGKLWRFHLCEWNTASKL